MPFSSSSTPTAGPTWDIFCRVIDNYGDIGVCWRLARQLHEEHGIQVRLWVDDLQALVQLWPEAQLTEHQIIVGIDVYRWLDKFPDGLTPAQLVIEAFGCEIPANYLSVMADLKQAGQAPLWINLEYLSAEDWVSDCHAKMSIHPATGLRKTFFFPGFPNDTGGLIREKTLANQRDQFQPDLWLKEKGISAIPKSLRVSLFAYENPSIAGLLNDWAASPSPIHCLVPAGKILTSINSALLDEPGPAPLEVGSRLRRGQLTLEVIPFLTQIEYDRLLWSCDINFVRGEDSFVRAQWATKPFIWHIYPQDEEAHLIKLQAFLDKYLVQAPAGLADSIRAFWMGWNTGEIPSLGWNSLINELSLWQTYSLEWSNRLAEDPDLATRLVQHSKANLG